MFKKGDRLKVKSHITKKDLQGIGYNEGSPEKVLRGEMEFVHDGFHGDLEKYTIDVLGYGSCCWIWKGWIQPKHEQLTFTFIE
jgi:hypothetical protein